MTSKRKEARIASGDFEGLFPFLILLLIGLVRFLTSKKKKEEESKKPAERPKQVYDAPVQKKSAPPLPVTPPPTAEKPSEEPSAYLEIKRDQHYWRKKKKTRVQRLVQNAGGSQKVILLSEILKKHDFLRF